MVLNYFHCLVYFMELFFIKNSIKMKLMKNAKIFKNNSFIIIIIFITIIIREEIEDFLQKLLQLVRNLH